MGELSRASRARYRPNAQTAELLGKWPSARFPDWTVCRGQLSRLYFLHGATMHSDANRTVRKYCRVVFGDACVFASTLMPRCRAVVYQPWSRWSAHESHEL